MAYQLKAARFPAYRDLGGFEFSSSEINEAFVRQLHRCEFIDDVNSVVLVGGPGTGKTHVSTALGICRLFGKVAERPNRPNSILGWT